MPAAGEAGGLSGRPLFTLSTALLAEMFRLTQGRPLLVGVGGIASAEDAYAKIRSSEDDSQHCESLQLPIGEVRPAQFRLHSILYQ